MIETLDAYLSNAVELKVDGLLYPMISSNLSICTVNSKLHGSDGFPTF